MSLRTLIAPLFAATVLASGCATTTRSERAVDHQSGTISSIDTGQRAGSSDSAVAGTVIGGVIGGAVGHQVGSGNTNDAATVAGAVGGAIIGRKIDQAHDRKDVFLIQVRFNDGSYQTVAQETLDGLRIGDNVLIVDDHVVRR